MKQADTLFGAEHSVVTQHSVTVAGGPKFFTAIKSKPICNQVVPYPLQGSMGKELLRQLGTVPAHCVISKS